MRPDEAFPLISFPSQVRLTLLSEFDGRNPSIGDVSQIPDDYLLTLPGIGTRMLRRIRLVTDSGNSQDDRGTETLSDAELLNQLKNLQRELRQIQNALEAKIAEASPLGIVTRSSRKPTGKASGRHLTHGMQNHQISNELSEFITW